MLFASVVKSAVVVSTLYASGVAALFNCSEAGLQSLAGPHTVMTTKNTPPSTTTMVWTIDLCAALESNSDANDAQCLAGTQVCGIQTVTIEGQDPVVAQVIPVAGDIAGSNNEGRVNLATESVRAGEYAGDVILIGGMWGDATAMEADVKFVCDPAYVNHTLSETSTPGLSVLQWDEQTLTLEWRTAEVCGASVTAAQAEAAEDDVVTITQSEHSTAWSVIKYILIAALLVLVAYFGITAYVNYSKGATGVDLLPSSEAILEIPYVAKDFVKKIGGGLSTNTSRDGYAVF
ncbi:autophagy-related protein 27 [Lipomyces arxii]|uniref:autophagy-related protein 27 n=1 Tax=Lipomyces arxii TaxID=56418 RepID=UPI0034CDFD21